MHILVDRDKKDLTLTGKGFAATAPWGGSQQYVHESLEEQAGLPFTVSQTVLVGNNVWYRGRIEGEDRDVWVHESSTKEETMET